MNLNTKFEFDGKLRLTLIVGMAIGLVSLLLSLVGDDMFQTRFWSNYLHNTVYFTGIAFMSIFFLCAQITAFAGWNSVIKRVWEAMGQFMLVGLVLVAVIVIAVWGHLTHLYHWNTPGITDPSNPIYDKVLAGKQGFLNPLFFTIGTLGVLGLWYFWYRNLRRLSIDQDTMETASFDYYKRQRKWAASFLPIAGFLSPVFLWLIMMSIDPHWYSTMFAWYSTISMWLGSLALTVMLIIYLKSRGYLEYVTYDHIHDVGKFLFGISVFWTYLWFDQFMLIWYANVGEETIYFKERMRHYPVLFWGNLLMNFIAPFLILMRNDTKRKFGTMFFAAAIVFFGHWWDFFYMVKPGARIAAQEAIEHVEGIRGGHQSGEVAPMDEHKDESHTAPNDPTENQVDEPGDAEYTDQQNRNPTNTVPAEGQSALGPEAEQRAADQAGGMVESGHAGGTAPGGQSGVPQPHGGATTAGGSETGGIQEPTDDTTQSQQTIATEQHADSMSASAPAGAEGQSGLSAPHGPEDHGGEHAADAGGEQGGTHGFDKSFKLGFTLPGLQEIGAMIGFLSLFLFVFFRALASTSLVPMRDPYLEESLHHTTGALIDSELSAEVGSPEHH
jgi:hypothetical protein